jgi:hypothetical protein
LKSHIQLVASLHARLRGDFEESFVTPSRANLTDAPPSPTRSEVRHQLYFGTASFRRPCNSSCG